MKIQNIKIGKLARGGAVFLIAVALVSMTFSEAFAQRGRGGRGGGGGGGMRGGGGYGGASRAPSYNRSPSMSRPSTPSRPSTGAVNRGGSVNRGGATNRAGAPNRAGSANRPGAANRGGATNRAAATGQAGRNANPSRNDLSSFLNSPSQGAARANARPAGGNSAVNDFFNHNSAGANHNAAQTHDRQAGSVAQQRSDNISNRGETRSNARDSRGENREFASDNRQDRVSDRGDRQSVRVSDRAETRSSLADGRAENRSERQQQRSEHADSIRDAIEQEFDDNHLFDEFWKNNPQAYYRFNQNPVFWTWATASTLGNFFGAGYASSGGEAYYDEGMVYSDGGQVPAEEYAEQAEEIVENTPEVENPDDMEWLPLGVFALSQSSNADAAPNLFLQLAVSKEGIIAGTLQNKTTDETLSVEGMVDMESGRAAWTVAGKSTPIMETKLEGLTANETNMLIHFDDGSTQDWLMLHIEGPKEE